MSVSPKFSVIIPNYNNADTLPRAIDSVLQQTYQNFEIIVIDDGSTDNSLQVLEKYSRDIVLLKQRNAGVSIARNKAVSIASGNWLAFLDADDIFHPDRLRLHAEWIQEESDLDFLLGEQESRDPNGNFLEFFMRNSAFGQALLERHKNEQRIPIPFDLFGNLISDGFCEIRTLSLPKAKFMALGGFPIEHKIGEDLHFFIRLFVSSKKAGVVPQTLATYFIYEKSALRQDALRTMQLFDKTLSSLELWIKKAPPHLQSGFQSKRRKVKLGLAYALLRSNQKKNAILTVMPSLLKKPGMQSLRDLVSVARGLRRNSET